MGSLAVTDIFDHSSQIVKSYTKNIIKGISDPSERAVTLYYSIRDGLQYYPYEIHLFDSETKASKIIKRGRGHCIDKAIVYVSCLRLIGIPAKIGFSKVVNHIGTERIERILKTNVLTPHGYVEMYLNNKWVKATPAFNEILCRFLNVNPLDFNAEEDSLFQEFDQEGNKFMQYLEDYGSFDEFPRELIIELLEEHYPHLFFDEGGNRVFQSGNLIEHYLKRNKLSLDKI